MSRISRVLKNKNRLEKEARLRRDRELSQMTKEASFKAKLRDSLRLVNTILDKSEVKSVVVNIPSTNLADFSRAIYEADMAEYNVRQISASRFAISRKELDF